jgi:hypothetical protein
MLVRGAREYCQSTPDMSHLEQFFLSESRPSLFLSCLRLSWPCYAFWLRDSAFAKTLFRIARYSQCENTVPPPPARSFLILLQL